MLGRILKWLGIVKSPRAGLGTRCVLVVEDNKVDLMPKIYIAGHRGMVGSALLRTAECRGFTDIVTRTHHQLDLLNAEDVDEFFASEIPDWVFLAAAKVG